MTHQMKEPPRYARRDLLALLGTLGYPDTSAIDSLAPTVLVRALLDSVGQRVDQPGFQGSFGDPLLDSLRDLHRFLHGDIGPSGQVDPALVSETLASVVKAYCYPPDPREEDHSGKG